jgi:hypothetical protein
MMLGVRVVNEELDHRVMHLFGSRITNRPPLEPFNLRPKVKMVPLDATCPFFIGVVAVA